MNTHLRKLLPPEVTSVLSDLAVCAGIADYHQALPKITQEDAKALIGLVEEYNNINLDQQLQDHQEVERAILHKTNDLLKGIIARP